MLKKFGNLCCRLRFSTWISAADIQFVCQWRGQASRRKVWDPSGILWESWWTQFVPGYRNACPSRSPHNPCPSSPPPHLHCTLGSTAMMVFHKVTKLYESIFKITYQTGILPGVVSNDKYFFLFIRMKWMLFLWKHFCNVMFMTLW